MSLQTVNLASIIGKAQKKKDQRSYNYAKETLEMLSSKLDENALSEYFQTPLSDREQKFFQKFFRVLILTLSTEENMVRICSSRNFKLNLETAKQLCLVFGIRLVKIEPKNLYLIWPKYDWTFV